MKIIEDNKQYIINEYSNGKSMDKLGKEFDCNSGTIYYALKKWNIETRKKQKFIGKIEDYDNQIKSMYESGIGSKKISKLLGICVPTILDRLKIISNVRKSDVDPTNLLKDKKEQVIELFNSGNSINKIAQTVGHNAVSVRKLLLDNGFDTSKYKCKYTVDETYFKKIDSHTKAYILGFFYSDGNIFKTKCRITLQAEDFQILEDIKREMNYTGELVDVPSRGTSKAQVCLNIDRSTIASQLICLGCIPRKSNVIKFPTSDRVPEEFINSFILGFFDGDGSITIRKNKYLGIGITSTDEFCKQLNTILIKNNILSGIFYYRRKDKPTGSLMINQHEECVKFLNWIYKDSPIRLSRKYLKAKPFLIPELQQF